MEKNEEAWERVFSDLELKAKERLDTKGKFVISSRKLKEVSKREPRLMTKFDHFSNLPKCFRDNHYSIMPISRFEYQLGHGEMYHKIETEVFPAPKKKPYPERIESLDAREVTSEQTALSLAHLSEMVDDFLGEKTNLTLQGRMASGIFDFKMHHVLDTGFDSLFVNNSQIEIDASYEGENSIAIFEAKLGICEDFLIRQLYYPYRMLHNKVPNKKIRLVFFTYSDQVYYFREYTYPEKEVSDYNGILLVKSAAYTLEDRERITLSSLRKWLRETKSLPEPCVPFPQANDFNRVIDILHLAEKGITKEQITGNYDFDPRQADYYANAAIYLSLLNKDKRGGTYFLNEEGKMILSLPYRERRKKLIERILQHEVFKRILALYLENDLREPDTKAMLEIMHALNLFHIGKEKTYKRRLSTIRNWIRWILESLEKE